MLRISYQPELSDKLVVSGAQHPYLRVSGSFFLAVHDPLMSFRSSPIHFPQGPNYTYYQVNRLSEPAIVDGVVISDYQGGKDVYLARMMSAFDVSHMASIRKTLLDAGSIILQQFNVASGKAEGQYYALTREQEVWHNLLRTHVPAPSLLSDKLLSVSSAHLSSFFDTWPDSPQRRAQLADLALVRKIERQKTPIGRTINWVSDLIKS